jgi:thiamine biosynthesis protein ThiS
MSDATISITVNGVARDVPQGLTVRALIESMGLGQAPCAAEVNRVLVPRREHETRTLAPGDSVELVTLVGGG